ncbi:MAG: hypothetical protein JWP09_742 [Candidatus Taylorbacteria bacterium]|nr:hypothetical protein [Candidatus Taylorbacteria bacterium]
MSNIEPTKIKTDCPYCANVPTNHGMSYFGSILSINIDPIFGKITKFAPKFLKRFVDWLPSISFPILNMFHLVKFSSDIEKVNTFRSRVVWEEANRRGLQMEQIIIFGKPIEFYRARLKSGKRIYFESIPIPTEFLDMVDMWDNKSFLKKVFRKNNIPVPKSVDLTLFQKPEQHMKKLQKIFDSFAKPIIVKPRVGSRGRHTTTNINSFDDFLKAIEVAQIMTPYIIVEEHLMGDVCRATLVNGKLLGFYRAGVPTVVGNGVSNIKELIEDKNKNKNTRIGEVEINKEILDYIGRSGFTLQTVPKADEKVQLTYRTGRLFGGVTKEMFDELHPSFIPILEKVGKIVGLGVAGFDCIVPDPTLDADSQKWGIIEANTLPFIDLHYYALEGKPKNIAGAVWDLWDTKR